MQELRAVIDDRWRVVVSGEGKVVFPSARRAREGEHPRTKLSGGKHLEPGEATSSVHVKQNHTHPDGSVSYSDESKEFGSVKLKR